MSSDRLLVPQPISLTSKLEAFARDIKISHTIFAMPWAILSTVMAWKLTGGPLAGKLVLILICMVAGRTVAMAFNRLLDARLDAQNARTADRAIPSGRVSPGFVLGIIGACGFLFITACALFRVMYQNPWPLALAVPVLAFISAYPLLKRFTRYCHYYLGAALALAPICAWVAVSGKLGTAPLLMAAAVLLWTAGFDIIYACQDYASDVVQGVFSVPAKLGVQKALWVARLTHVLCMGALILLGWMSPELGKLYAIGVGVAGVLLIVEHAIVRPDDLSKVNVAFFTVNGIISVLLSALGIADVLR